jgi:bifunctional ADP-heptose synthase (sugar kinase/adenylyltransferase)
MPPDHLVKGGDWTPSKIVGAQEVAGWGGTVHSIAFPPRAVDDEPPFPHPLLKNG